MLLEEVICYDQCIFLAELSLGRAAGVEGRRVRETERTTLSRGSHSQVLWSSGSFLVCLLPGILNWDPSWWDFFGRNNAKAETPGLWPPHVKS